MSTNGSVEMESPRPEFMRRISSLSRSAREVYGRVMEAFLGTVSSLGGPPALRGELEKVQGIASYLILRRLLEGGAIEFSWPKARISFQIDYGFPSADELDPPPVEALEPLSPDESFGLTFSITGEFKDTYLERMVEQVNATGILNVVVKRSAEDYNGSNQEQANQSAQP